MRNDVGRKSAAAHRSPLFWFEGNMAWGECPREWERIKAAYPKMDLRTALVAPHSLQPPGLPSFGFYSEHVGPMTLGEFMDQHGMQY